MTSRHLQRDLTRSSYCPHALTPRSRSDVIQFIVLFPRRKAWIGPMKGCRCMIIALHLSGWGTNRLLSHYFFKSAKVLLSLFVNESMVSVTQYRVVSSAYN